MLYEQSQAQADRVCSKCVDLQLQLMEQQEKEKVSQNEIEKLNIANFDLSAANKEL